MKKIWIDKDLCLGCGLCSAIAEKAFKLSEEGKAEVLDISKEDPKKLKEAIDSCPTGAIKEEE